MISQKIVQHELRRKGGVRFATEEDPAKFANQGFIMKSHLMSQFEAYLYRAKKAFGDTPEIREAQKKLDECNKAFNLVIAKIRKIEQN